MTTTIRQCIAIKPDGSRCRRTAQRGSTFCYSHRNYRLKQSPASRRAHNIFMCADCNRPIPPGESLSEQVEGEEIVLLCEPCFRLRRLIEGRIIEACNVLAGLTKEKIGEDLARFGVPREMAEAARIRLHSDGRLVYSRRK